jgi:hypothetical protein
MPHEVPGTERVSATSKPVMKRSVTRRHLLATVLVAPVMGAMLAACGDDSAPASSPPVTDVTTDETSGSPALSHPTGADDVVLRVDQGVNGFTTAAYSFARTPTVVIAGDGTVITPGVMTMQFPGPLVAPLSARQLDEEGIRTVLSLAADKGLLDAPPPDYTEGAPQVTDVGSTIVTLDATGTPVVHEAYALGIEGEDTPARKALQEFVAAVSDLSSLVGAEHLGAEAPFAPTEYAVQAMPVDVADYSGDVAPTVVPWPSTTGVTLSATVDNCVVVPAADLADVLKDATELTFFTEGAVTYQLLVRPQTPGAPGCD